MDGRYVFETQANLSTAKSPMGAFEDKEIDNDITAVIEALERVLEEKKMKKWNDYESTQAYSENEKLPVGGYVLKGAEMCVWMRVRTETVTYW